MQSAQNGGHVDKKTGIILGVLAVGFCALIGISIWQSNANKIDYSDYDNTAVQDPNDDTGGIGDLIDGDPDAPVKIYEYGDYQCDACAPMNPHINELIEEYDGKVAVVFRATIMSYHQNGTAAAAAANAAALQGYWKEYKDTLFSNQNDWFYSSAEERQPQFEEYFMLASNGKGDLAKFRQDMTTTAVQHKINYDEAMASKAGVEYTPTFFIEDKLMDQRGKTTTDFLQEMRDEIDHRLEEKGIKK